MGSTSSEHDYGVIRGLGVEYIEKPRPAIAGQLGMSPRGFDRFSAPALPVLARGVRELPPAVALVDPVIPKLRAIQDDFAKVDGIPGAGLPGDVAAVAHAPRVTSVAHSVAGTGHGDRAVMQAPRACAPAAAGASNPASRVRRSTGLPDVWMPSSASHPRRSRVGSRARRAATRWEEKELGH